MMGDRALFGATHGAIAWDWDMISKVRAQCATRLEQTETHTTVATRDATQHCAERIPRKVVP